jgi:hypothetical protein
MGRLIFMCVLHILLDPLQTVLILWRPSSCCQHKFIGVQIPQYSEILPPPLDRSPKCPYLAFSRTGHLWYFFWRASRAVRFLLYFPPYFVQVDFWQEKSSYPKSTIYFGFPISSHLRCCLFTRSCQVSNLAIPLIPTSAVLFPWNSSGLSKFYVSFIMCCSIQKLHSFFLSFLIRNAV